MHKSEESLMDTAELLAPLRSQHSPCAIKPQRWMDGGREAMAEWQSGGSGAISVCWQHFGLITLDALTLSRLTAD